MLTLLGLSNVIGVIASSFVFLSRAGFSEIKARQGIDWREFLITNLPYFILTVGKMFVWWIVLIFWAVSGRPQSPWQAVTSLNGREVRRVLRK